MDGWVEGLDAAIEHFGGAGDVFDRADRVAGGGESGGGSAGGDEVPAAGGEAGG